MNPGFAMPRRTKRRFVLAVLISFLSGGSAFAQLEGRLSLEKEEYKVGEPIFLLSEITNTGKEAIQFVRGDRYSYCGGYRIEVLSTPPLTHSSCDRGYAVSCPGGARIMAPGETLREKVLVNYEHPLSKPGFYEIQVALAVNYGPRTEEPSYVAGLQSKTEAHFRIKLTQADGDGESPEAAFQPFLAELASKDENRQREAGRVIGSLAPAFLEDTILSMMNTPSTRGFALLGLKRLNTERSRQALANIVETTAGYTWEKELAIRSLAEMKDKKYFPLLLDEAKKHAPNEAGTYISAAAELGGDDAVAFLVSLVGDRDPFSRANGMRALAQTGSRRAVPILIEALKSRDADLARLAFMGLVQLTHRTPLANGEMSSTSPSQQYANWLGWWSLHGNSAAIYGPRECGEIEPLK
jgi:hypothetical protein